MRTTFAAAALVAIAAAKPVPQELDFAFLDSVSLMPTATIPVVGIKAQATTVDYNPTTASAAVAASVSAVGLEKRAVAARSACEPQPTGALSPALPDTYAIQLQAQEYHANFAQCRHLPCRLLLLRRCQGRHDPNRIHQHLHQPRRKQQRLWIHGLHHS